MASRIQCDAIMDMMKHQAEEMGHMSPDMRSKMASLASSGAWHQDHLAKILDQMAPPQPKAKAARGKMQKAAPNIIH